MTRTNWIRSFMVIIPLNNYRKTLVQIIYLSLSNSFDYNLQTSLCLLAFNKLPRKLCTSSERFVKQFVQVVQKINFIQETIKICFRSFLDNLI